jgi:hypothetical protein
MLESLKRAWLICMCIFFTSILWAQTTVDTHGIQGAVPNLAVQARIIAVIGIVYAALQALKLAFPAIAGGWAILLNVIFSAAGIVVALPAEKVFSLETLTAVIVAAIGAAGVHGTVSSMRNRAQLKSVARNYPPIQPAATTQYDPHGPTKGRHP